MARCRHTAALVSRRWHAAAHSPQLLADVLCPNADSRRLESLTAWLPRHGQHVRSLDLSCHPEDGESGPVTWQLAGCLQAFAAVAGSLERLSLSAQSEPGLCVTPWAAALRRLVRLSLWADPCTLRICSSLSGLTALTALTLSGTPVKIDAAVQLPPNVELLWFIDRQGEELPPQVRLWGARMLLQVAMLPWSGCNLPCAAHLPPSSPCALNCP